MSIDVSSFFKKRPDRGGSMRRFFLPPGLGSELDLTLTGREAHHALRVTRLRPHDRVLLLDGAGSKIECEVRQVGRETVDLKILSRQLTPAPPCQITLLQAIPKGKIFEDILQKAVELGVARVIPLVTERVVPQWKSNEMARKQEQWRTVTVEAIKQCGQPWLPQVDPPTALASLLDRGENWDLGLVGSLHGDGRHPRHWFDDYFQNHATRPRRVAIWIGPEGDFSAEEVSAIKQRARARPITLGQLVLRCETAATYCLSIVNYETQARTTET